MSTYADTSFLVSLYVLDANSALAAERMEHAKFPILLTPLSELELTNAITLRIFRKELQHSKAKVARGLVDRDLTEGVLQLKPLTMSIFDLAKQISLRRTPPMGTRTLDILHVASALGLRADSFYTFEHHQEKLAKAEGLTVF